MRKEIDYSCFRLVPTLAAFLILFVRCEEQAKGADDLEIIRSAVREYVTSIRSIRVHWSISKMRNPNWHVRYDGTTWDSWNHEWTEQGDQWLLVTGPMSTEGGESAKSWTSFNGKRAHTISWDPEEPTGIRAVFRTTDTDQFRHIFKERNPAFLLGNHLHNCDLSLVELLGDRSLISVRDEIDDQIAVKVDFGAIPLGDRRDQNLTVWFDPTRGFLPKRFKFQHQREINFHGTGVQWDEIVEIHDWERVADSLLGERWVPKTVIYTTPPLIYRVEVNDVEFNRSYPNSQFVPKIPDGTLVIDGPVIPGRPYKSSIAGGARAVDAAIRRRVKEAEALEAQVPVGAALVDASIIPESLWWLCLLWGSIAALVIGLVWRFTPLLRGR